MIFDIIEARDPALRDEIFRFRYDIYVREMSRAQKDADHERSRIEDPLDQAAVLLAARDATGQVIGTVRANVAADQASLGLYEGLYGLRRLTPAERARTSITTRLMIARRWRRSALALELASALYVRGLDRGIEVDYIDCNAHLVSFFEHLGYRGVRRIHHPDYGEVTLMRIDLQDAGYLRRAGSPFAHICETRVRVA